MKLFASSLCLAASSLFATPKNIILMIGDGMGPEHVRATGLYLYGKDSTVMDAFPVQGWMSTFSLGGNYISDSAQVDTMYVVRKPTDSAASATALSTGVKTYDAAIGVDINGAPLITLTESAAVMGKSSGVATTVPISHATPGGMSAHQWHRNSYSEIAREMIFNSKLDVVIGGGHPYYDADGKFLPEESWNYNYCGGPDTWNQLQAGSATNLEGNLWTLVQTKTAIDSIAAGTRKAPRNLIGVMPVYETMQQRRSSSLDNIQTEPLPYSTPKLTNTPTLSNIALAALNTLSQNPDGFFLMVEGGAIDWASHSNQSARMIEETADFLAAVQSVRQWIEKNGGWSENLLIVTSDHETGYLSSTQGRTNPVTGNGKGNLPNMRWNQPNHTNKLVRIVAQGIESKRVTAQQQGTDSRVGSYTDNALIGQFLHTLLTDQWQFASSLDRIYDEVSYVHARVDR